MKNRQVTGSDTPTAAGPIPGVKSPVDGRVVGHYKLIDVLGTGGMGIVYRAEDVRLKRNVALKFLADSLIRDEVARRRFLREAQAISAIDHPNLCTVHEVGESDDGQLFIAMPCYDGRPLSDLELPIPVASAVGLVIQAAHGLARAHASGIIHRDIKPGNLFLTADGVLKVLDFGLAKMSGSSTITKRGVLVGTLQYMAPEQFRNETLGPQTDIWALGIVLYELLTGGRPFKGDVSEAVIYSILNDTPVSLGERFARAPEGLVTVLGRMLEKDPKKRFASMDELIHALDPLVQRHPSHPHDPTLLLQQSRIISRPMSGSPVTRALLLQNGAGVTALLACVFAFNWLETAIEAALQKKYQLGAHLGLHFAAAASWFERGLSFAGHDLTNQVAVYAGSFAYFFLFPALALITMAVLWNRPTIDAYRTFGLAITVTYLTSLFFYIVFPVPERWAYSQSEAILLSDLWSSKLIEAVRPISGLDNCFPSFHVSSAVVIALVWILFRIPGRAAVAFLSFAVAVSTFLLGIHWLADIVAGAALGVIAVAVAIRINGKLTMTGKSSGSRGSKRSPTPPAAQASPAGA